jgi:acetyl esterase/lipase
MKKVHSFFFAAFVTLNFFAQPWPTSIDTTNGKYWDTLFPAITITSNVPYGSNVTVNNTTQTLLMDIYEPTNNTIPYRPLIILAHGGSFISGVKTSPDVVTLAKNFAKMGYVVASIAYRLGIGFPIDSINATRAVIRATQDMKAAVRFFRQDALGPNVYKTHPNFVFAGGVSAGAFMGLHLAYMDKLSEVPSWANISNLGGIDGNSGNPGFSHKVNAVINLCGALGDSAWLEPGDIPFVSMHGDADQTVPFGTAMIYVLSFDVMIVDGSSSDKVRATNVGVSNDFFPFWGADHTPFVNNTNYMDTTIRFVKTFLRPLLALPSTTGLTPEQMNEEVSLYPNPVSDHFTLCVENCQGKKEIRIMEITGRTIVTESFSDRMYFYQNRLKPGLYLVEITNGAGFRSVKRFVVQ